MVTRPQQPVIVPIGQPLGSIYRPESRLPQFRVRIGDDVISLTPPQALIWEAAHATAPGRTTGSTFAELVEIVREPLDGLDADIESAIEMMLDLEVLTTLPMNPAAMVEFAQDYRMLALLHGLGNAPDRMDGFGFGLGEDGFALAGLLDSEMIAHAAAFGSIYDVCEYFASAVGLEAGSARLATPASLSEQLVGSLAPYLHTHTVCIDLALSDAEEEAS